MPPFHPKQIIPVPAPTAPSSTGPDPAPRTAVRDVVGRDLRPAGVVEPRVVALADHGDDDVVDAERGVRRRRAVRPAPSHARPTCMVEVSTIGVSSHPSSRTWMADVSSPAPLRTATPAPERLGHHACGRAGDDGRHACAGDASAGRRIGLVAPHRRVTDQDAGHVGDGVGGPGRQHADGDAQIARRGRGRLAVRATTCDRPYPSACGPGRPVRSGRMTMDAGGVGRGLGRPPGPERCVVRCVDRGRRTAGTRPCPARRLPRRGRDGPRRRRPRIGRAGRRP